MTPPLLLLLALVAACGDDPVQPTPTPKPQVEGHAFIYAPPPGAPTVTSMSVRGSFNGWAEKPMGRQSDGTWKVIVPLDSTVTYQYKFFINGQWIVDMCYDETWGQPGSGYVVDPDADGCVDDGNGGQNATIRLAGVGLGFAHSATDPADVSVAGGRLSVRFSANADRVQSASLISGADTVAMAVQMTLGLEEVWRGSLPTSVSSYTIHVVTATGEEDHGPYTPPAQPFTAVPWAGDAVAYQILTDRFWNGDPSNDSLTLSTDEFVYNELWTTNGPTLTTSWNGPVTNQLCCHQYFGGDLQGIVDKLDHLSALGVTAIYLNPIWHSGSAHGYDTFDYKRLAPEFGDSTMLRTFLDAAHARGMKVIWDFVPNHVGLGFWAFQDAVQNGQASPYWNWFNFHPDADGLQAGDGDDYDGWWGTASLPELQTQRTDVLDYLIGVATDWTAYGFDGIRVDVPGDIGNRTQFFRAFRDATKAIDPDVYLVGEIWQRDPSWLQGDQFDALMNYAVGRDVIARYANGEINGPGAWYGMAQLYAAYPEAATGMLFNVIATHDTDRLLTQLGGGDLGASPGPTAIARQEMASALLYAIPGMPVTYYGDECAQLGSATGSEDRARYPLQWDACDATMLAHYERLGDLKHSLAALGSPVIREYRASGSLLSFYRGEPGTGEVLAVFNDGSATSLPLPAGTWSDAVAGTTLTGTVQVPSFGWLYLVRQ